MNDKSKDIEFIIDYWFNNGLHSLAASDMYLENSFIKGRNKELSDRLWKDRIKSAANRLGLTPRMLYYDKSLPATFAGSKEMIYS